MNDHIKKENRYEVGLQRVLSVLWYKLWVVVLVSVVCAVVTFAAVYFFVTPQYQSSTAFYVNNSDLSVGDTVLDISSGDISASKDLVASYIVILNSRDTLTQVREQAGVDYSISTLRKMITAEAVNSTEIFEVVVTSTDVQEAYDIALAIQTILPARIDEIIDGTNANTVDKPLDPSTVSKYMQSSPNYGNCALIGFILGFVLAVVVLVLQEVFDVTIRSEEDMAQVCQHPVLAAVPDMGAPSKGSYYYYGYGSKRRGSNTAAGNGVAPVLMGGQISFAASEAYKLLRTKLQFSFVDEKQSRVIGFSSALSGEGKSLTAVNLAYTLSQLDKKVILIDCDMRRPTLAEKLSIHKTPGLSGYLTSQHKWEEMIQPCNLKNEEDAFSVIAAGQNPPNPIELLSSERMTKFLEQLRKEYQYIILDLPPVGEVSDAMAVAAQTDGMLLVVRQNYCDRLVLREAIRQFEFINARMLGVVYNCTVENGARYGKGYYKRYYRRYYRGYYKRSYRRYDSAYAPRKNAEGEAGEKQ